MNLCTKHLHTLHIGMLALYICLTHKYLTFHIHKRADCSCGNTMLTSTCLGNDTSLAHLLCHEYLTNSIVNLMGTCMIQVFTLQIELATILLAHSLSIV